MSDLWDNANLLQRLKLIWDSFGKSHVIPDAPQMELPFEVGSSEWVDFQDKWIFLGVAPRPKTEWRWFIHHLCHGVIMGFPFVNVVFWSWRNRHIDNFEFSEDDLAVVIIERNATE